MKILTAVVVAMGLAITSFTAQAVSNEVVFLCDTPTGKHAMLEYSSENDVFTLSYGDNLDVPEVTVMKRGNNMGTSYHSSSVENTTLREVYISDTPKFYTLGYSNDGAKASGYVQVMENGTEVSYEDCKTIRSKFDDYKLFKNMTDVD